MQSLETKSAQPVQNNIGDLEGILEARPPLGNRHSSSRKPNEAATLNYFDLNNEEARERALHIQESLRRQHFHKVHTMYEAFETEPGAVNALRRDTVNNIAAMQWFPRHSQEAQEYFEEMVPDEDLRKQIQLHYSEFFTYVHREVARAVLSPRKCETMFADKGLLSRIRKNLPAHLIPAAEELTEQLIDDYYQQLNNLIDEEKLAKYEQNVCYELDWYDDGYSLHKRKRNIILLNGPVGSGKGTTLEQLEAEAVETGTAGIAGRGGQSKEKRDKLEGGPNRYDRWEYVSGGLDRSRKKQRRIPDRVMRMWLAMELMQKRGELDAEGKFDEPIYISGYPREVDQTKLFAHLDQEQVVSVYMEISEQEAATRTLSRMIEQSVATAMDARAIENAELSRAEKDARLAKLEYYRGDDFKSLDFSNAPEVRQMILRFNKDMLAALQIVDPHGKIELKKLQEKIKKAIFENHKAAIEQLLLARGDEGHKGEARYHLDMRNKRSIIEASESMGIETIIVQCDGKAPPQVTEEVAQYVRAA